MDPVKEPMCEVCGAATDLVGRPEAGWVCAIPVPCLQRSARAIMGELRDEDPTFGMASDIPASWLPADTDIPEQNQVIVVTPYHKEVLGEEAAASWRELVKSARPVELDQLHPTGRCTCGGEGECEWCKGLCPACLGDCYETQCPVCDSTGWRPDEPELPDYEALGYPETESRAANLAAYHVVAGNIVTMASYWAGGYAEPAAEKDIPSSTDIVDSGDTDSYK